MISYKFNRVKNKSTNLSYVSSADKIIQIKNHDKETGLTISTDIRLSILKPTKSFRPTKDDVTLITYEYSSSFVLEYLDRFTGLVALDLETKGTNPLLPDTFIAGIGLADDKQICYIDFQSCSKEVRELTLRWVTEYEAGFIAHNVFFDASFLQYYTGKFVNFKICTYGMYRQLANEGYSGQTWGLKSAQEQLLNWEEKGDIELDEWLVNNDFYTSQKKDEHPGWIYREDLGRYCNPSKGDMYRAPVSILGYYCGLDSVSTYQLYYECFLPSIDGNYWQERFEKYHELFINNVKYHVKQFLTGMTIHNSELYDYQTKLKEEITNHYMEFVKNPEVSEFIKEFNQGKIKEQEDKEPAKFLKLPKLSSEPAKITKAGKPSKNYIKWLERKQMILNLGEGDLSGNWIKWMEKLEIIKMSSHFNLNSGANLSWLFYTKLGFPVIIKTKTDKPSTGIDALPGFGGIGKLLKAQKDKVKLEGYVNGCLNSLLLDDNDTYRLHPQFRLPGTLTCRLAGSGGMNIQQIPKDRPYLETLRPLTPGNVWVDCDHKALEMVVLAELTRDKTLLSLYGPTARANDVYLYNAAIMARDYGLELFKPILSLYNPDMPTEESIKECKKKYKKLRAISKTATLGKSYGMGWELFKLRMHCLGVTISEQDARSIISGLDKVYAGLKVFENKLRKEWEDNNGWVYNGIGRPVGCSKDNIKDIVNRVVQSTGHDIHMMYIDIINYLFSRDNIEVNGIVWDFHDQSIVECFEKDKDKVYHIMGTEAYQILNDQLDGLIKLEGDPQFINSMADAKCE